MMVSQQMQQQLVCYIFVLVNVANAFTTQHYHYHQQQQQLLQQNNNRYNIIDSLLSSRQNVLHKHYSTNEDDNDEYAKIHPSGNPYADPNYPDLEFINYDDPEYQIDYGVSVDEDNDNLLLLNSKKQQTEAAIEFMREERRRKNDEYQFQTYYKDILKNGQLFYGEWTIYKTSTFFATNDMNDVDNDTTTKQLLSTKSKTNDYGFTPPKLIVHGGSSSSKLSSSSKSTTSPTVLVTSRGYKEVITPTAATTKDASFEILSSDMERIRHVQSVFSDENNINVDPIISNIISSNYWPEILSPNDFRGHQGIMVCGNAYTICTAKTLHTSEDVPMSSSLSSSSSSDYNDESAYKGPFSEYKAEVGILDKNIRLRIKFDYSILVDDNKERQQQSLSSSESYPLLHLKTMTICREMIGDWPSALLSSSSSSSVSTSSASDMLVHDAFYGPAGADGGLYDPPPILSDEQALQYMIMDIPGHASVLFPYVINQNPLSHNGYGWVHTIDWTPGSMRYQVDRKVNNGIDLLGLRTLELSEVQGIDAETYRPRDGGQNMRQ